MSGDVKRKRGRGMTKGIRFIAGKEFMLSGRFTFRSEAVTDADLLRREWDIVKVLKTPHMFGEYSVWVHGAK